MNDEEKKLEIKQDTLNTLDDFSICIMCNRKCDTLELNWEHMRQDHQLEFPMANCLKRIKPVIKILAQKVFKYLACIQCDSQKFINHKALQNHILDTKHTAINDEDIEEFFYKYYSKDKLAAIKSKIIRKTKVFKILKIKLNFSSKSRKNKVTGGEESDGWETISEGSGDEKPKVDKPVKAPTTKMDDVEIKEKVARVDSDDDEPIELPNGELVLENGLV